MTDTSPIVMLVDDDLDLRRLLTMRLRSAGYRVEAVASGEEALGRLSKINPSAVITDMKMEGMSGMELFEAVHRRHPSLPIIILTAYGSIPEAVAATRKGVFGYLTKPCNSEELRAHLQQAIRACRLSDSPRDNAFAPACAYSGMVGGSTAMQAVWDQAVRVAETSASILIQSESGTGKELLAKAIHKASDRHRGPFVAVNCSAIPEPLLESELFGHVKGAFTGAFETRKGLFEEVSGGTLFLDEVGDMPLPFQGTLLRVLQEHEVRAVGANKSTPVDVRIISATHRNLERSAREGAFREDLFYRLNVIKLELPPLRERREDIPLLTQYFLDRLAQRDGIRKCFSPEAQELLIAASWPGNVRQLNNVIEQTFALSPGPVVSAELVAEALNQKRDETLPLNKAKDHFEWEYLSKLLRATEGNVSQAARLARRNRTEFYKLLARHRLSARAFRS